MSLDYLVQRRVTRTGEWVTVAAFLEVHRAMEHMDYVCEESERGIAWRVVAPAVIREDTNG